MFFLNVEQKKLEWNGWEEQEKRGAFERKGKKREEKERGDKEENERKRARPMRAGPFFRCEEFMDRMGRKAKCKSERKCGDDHLGVGGFFRGKAVFA